MKSYEPLPDALDACADSYGAKPPGSFRGEANVEVVTHDLLHRLVSWIEEQEVIVGCVAWLTSIPVLEALKGKRKQIVMQKEDWFRPDTSRYKHPAISRPELFGISPRVRAVFEVAGPGMLSPSRASALGSFGSNYTAFGEQDTYMISGCEWHDLDSYRVLGFVGKNRPVMHHKFLVGCKSLQADPLLGFNMKPGDELDPPLEPLSAWAGSANFTYGLGRNLDFAVILRSPEAALPFYTEWQRALVGSEPLPLSADDIQDAICNELRWGS